MSTENNKIIAEFMGGQYTYGSTDVQMAEGLIYIPQIGGLEIKNIKYHSDWNWLMEVVEKIFELDLYYDKYIDFNASMFSNGKIQLSTRIDLVYNQCVEFIKWYNEQNK